MKIGIDASRANHEQKTGVEWYAYFLIQELKKLKNEEIQVILYSDEPLRGELAELPENWQSKVLRWPPKRFWTQIRMSLEMLFHPPDVLFIPAHVFPLIHPKKTVMTVHDVAAIRYPKSYNWFERWYSLWSARYAAKKLWRVITPSEFTKRELEATTKYRKQKNTENIGLLSNVFVVNHGYDKAFHEIKNKTEIEKVLKKYGLRQPFFLTIGRLEEKKNTARLIQAFNMFRGLYHHDFQLVLAGKPGYGYEKVQQAIETSPFRNDIIVPGWMNEHDLSILLTAAEVFVFPSLYEGFGIPILEAFAAGVPVITSRGNSCEEIAGDTAILVHSEDTDDIANALQELTQNTELRNRLVEKGKKRAAGFSWQKCAEETWQVITS